MHRENTFPKPNNRILINWRCPKCKWMLQTHRGGAEGRYYNDEEYRKMVIEKAKKIEWKELKGAVKKADGN